VHIFSFFQPHHNPRLLGKQIRQIEICELEQAAAELLRAVQRAKERVVRKPVDQIEDQHFDQVASALEFVVTVLQSLSDQHPGDDPAVVSQMIEERKDVMGWETWSALLAEQLAASGGSFDTGASPENSLEESAELFINIKRVA